ncbi:MAG: glycosyltransferase family 39 protein [Ktedonobacteraceae bacterium]
MIFTGKTTQTTVIIPFENETQQSVKADNSNRNAIHRIAWICLLLTCLGTSWFAYQYFTVPQPQYYAPDWHGAQWIRASDSDATTAYFRYTTGLNPIPDNGFVTISASQIFHLYVNGILIGSSDSDFGNYPRAYVYEITPLLVSGANTIAIRVDNLDAQIPMLRATVTMITGDNVSYSGTVAGTGWMGTTQTSLAYPQNIAISQVLTAWTGQTFTTSSWQPILPVAQSPTTPSLTVNPLLYEQPVTTSWITAGTGQDTYFVRQVSLPTNSSASWLRIASTGTTNIFINGNLVITWNYQLTRIRQIVKNKTTHKTSVRYENELMLRVYNVSPYLHAGSNTIAVHVSTQNANGVTGNSPPVNTRLAIELAVSDQQGHMSWLTSAAGWKVSRAPMTDWATSTSQVSTWASPIETGRPVGYRLVYLSDNNLLTNEQQTPQIIPVTLTFEVISGSLVIALGSWLLMSLVVMRRYFCTRRDALEATSLAYLPALALEGGLIALSGEPRIPRPFPYTGFWAIVLFGLVGVSYLLLWLYVSRSISGHVTLKMFPSPVQSLFFRVQQVKGHVSNSFPRLMMWLRRHWAIIPLILLTTPMVFYNLGYEAFWQDELVSYDVAKSIIHNGLPLLPSGFVYPKGELYSYILALTMKLFGDQASILRSISAVEYLATLVVLYFVGCYFFDRRIALLATVMLALSPQELIWAREVRMYQQAQLLTLITAFLFYKALQEPRRVRLIYGAVAVLLITYLSHEETFIILPALVFCVLLASWRLRSPGHRLPEVFYQKHWWIAAGIGVSIIAIQLLIVNITHPPLLGTDSSNRPEVQITTENITYYFTMLFSPTANFPVTSNGVNVPTTVVLNTVLAVLGCFWARKSDRLHVKYVALFLVISFLTLLFIFTMLAERYFYPLATFYYLMAAFALMKILRAIRAFSRLHTHRQKPVKGTFLKGHTYRFLPVDVLVFLTATLVCLSVLIVPMLPLGDYNLFTSRALGLPYYQHVGDYEEAGQYVRQHLRKGDIVISIIPDSIVLYYVGQSDYFFSIEHALFIFENDGHIVDTYTGKTALLNQSDLNTVLNTHARIWLISADSANQSSVRHVLKSFVFPSDFHIVYAGTSSIVFLRGG